MRSYYLLVILTIPYIAIAYQGPTDPLLASLRDPSQGPYYLLFGIAFGVTGILVTRQKIYRLVLAMLAATVSAACFAPEIPVPNTFENGQPADADQVNANFEALVTQIADHADNEDIHTQEQSAITLEADGSVSIKAPGSSTGIILRPNGDIEITGNTVAITAGGNATLDAGSNITANAGINTSINSGDTTSLQSNTFALTVTSSATVDAGTFIATNAGTNTSFSSGGAIAIQGTTIDLN